ncbi:phage tail protein [Tritonibacter mobilis]|uniref:phage tail protein n=2 Tax=Alphaproteobacteria TaxID=28211 RepID=UPI001C97CD95|nr:tail fiber protein [Tritonibacter mobilis]MBY5998250.1 tail fiber protein [Tritonibacter mobilis]
MTNSLPRDGQAPMQGELPMGGNKITGLATGTANNDAATVAQANSASPIGTVVSYAGTTAPERWLLCYGQAVSRTTYATLFSVIGTAFGAGDGTTTFNVPDCRGRVAAGKDNMGGTAAERLTSGKGGVAGITLGASGGVEEHALTVAELAEHDHSGNTGQAGKHKHSSTARIKITGSGAYGQFDGGSSFDNGTYNFSDIMNNAPDHSHTIPSDGSGEAHPNVQPTIVFNTIIKAL